jgi:radical SAM superfamily enzyme YgiQ (UPF0313 family)
VSRDRDGILLVSCYELGHQPLAVASLAAFLERRGFAPRLFDLAVEPLERLTGLVEASPPWLAAFSVPMHTALRVGVRAASALRRRVPDTHFCFFGLYASLNAEHLLAEVADSVVGGECEPPIVALAETLSAGRPPAEVPGLRLSGRPAPPWLERLDFPAPSRGGLPPLVRYAQLEHAGQRRLAAAVEASRGCLHRCRHCPITPVYGGRFFVVPREVVMRDVRHLVAQGASHVTFADPDFLNGPRHARAIARELHETFPALTFDVTTKIEHVLEHRAVWPELAEHGCLFVVSAVESLSDVVLGHLDKGHTRSDVFAALDVLRSAGIALRPSLVAFTPWTSLEDYLDLVLWIDDEGLHSQIDPIQLSIRLLVPPESPLATLPAMRPHLRQFDAAGFQHAWEHPDPRMDRLHREVSGIVAVATREDEPATRTFASIREVAFTLGGRTAPQALSALAAEAALAPRLTEPWFC